MAVDCQRNAPAALSSEKTQNPLYGRLGGPQSRSGRVRKIDFLLFHKPFNGIIVIRNDQCYKIFCAC